MLNFFAIKKATESFSGDLMGWDCRFFEELIKGFMILDFIFVWQTRIVVAIENEWEMSGIENLLVVVIKVDLLTRDYIREVQFFKTKNTKEPSLLILYKHSKCIVEKEILELIRRKIKEYSFSSKEFVSIWSEFDLKLDGAEPKDDVERLNRDELSFAGSKVG